MNNPFETIDARLKNIEYLILDLKYEKSQPENDKLLTIDKAAEFLNLSKPTLYRLVSERNIPHSKKGKRLYFSIERLTEWVESGEVRTKAQIKKEVCNG